MEFFLIDLATAALALFGYLAFVFSLARRRGQAEACCEGSQGLRRR
jgi:hypothetical protein